MHQGRFLLIHFIHYFPPATSSSPLDNSLVVSGDAVSSDDSLVFLASLGNLLLLLLVFVYPSQQVHAIVFRPLMVNYLPSIIYLFFSNTTPSNPGVNSPLEISKPS